MNLAEILEKSNKIVFFGVLESVRKVIFRIFALQLACMEKNGKINIHSQLRSCSLTVST